MVGDFDVFLFLRSWRPARFLITCISATSFKFWPFSAFFNISETTRTNFFQISSQNLPIYNISETFIKIDSLQHLEILRQSYPTNLSKICVATFTALLFFPKWCPLYIPPWLVLFSLNLSHVLNVKHWQYSPCNVLAKISITSKQWML